MTLIKHYNFEILRLFSKAGAKLDFLYEIANIFLKLIEKKSF
jgi:hypothetical protein